jgi:O-methyltransferase
VIAFAYLDSDFYESILVSLEHVYPRLPRNGLMIIDDYGDKARNPLAWDELPGVKLACDDFFADKPEKVSVLIGTGDLPFGLVRKQ